MIKAYILPEMTEIDLSKFTHTELAALLDGRDFVVTSDIELWYAEHDYISQHLPHNKKVLFVNQPTQGK